MSLLNSNNKLFALEVTRLAFSNKKTVSEKLVGEFYILMLDRLTKFDDNEEKKNIKKTSKSTSDPLDKL